MLENRLKELRTEKNLTKKEVANYLKIDQSTYGKYELGKREPDYETLDKLATFFECSVDYLLGRTDIRNESYIISGTGNESFAIDKDIPQEVRKQIVNYAEFLIKKYKEKRNSKGETEP